MISISKYGCQFDCECMNLDTLLLCILDNLIRVLIHFQYYSIINYTKKKYIYIYIDNFFFKFTIIDTLIPIIIRMESVESVGKFVVAGEREKHWMIRRVWKKR